MALKKANRILRRVDFQHAYRLGREVHSRYFALFVIQLPETEATRFGFTATKRLGSAVVRNRVRRRLRECVREALDAKDGLRVNKGCDIVVNAKHPAIDAPMDDLRRALRECLRKGRAAAE